MSELARQLIAEAQADLASRLEAIEAATGLIEEAETLAATLRHHGIEARSYGNSFAAYWQTLPRCVAGVSIGDPDANTLRIALQAADLKIHRVDIGQHLGTLHLEGLNAEISLGKELACELQTLLLRTHQEPAHA